MAFPVPPEPLGHPSSPYLHVESFAVFVSQETIDTLIARFDADPRVFEPVQQTITDHVGESALMTIIVTHGAELLLLPFNHFHDEFDYEIGLTIDRTRSIAEIERRTASLGWEYESGTSSHHGAPSYYLIPTQSGVFPGFFVTSELDVTRNRHFSSLCSFTAGVGPGALSTANDFVSQFLPDNATDFRFREMEKNRFISASFDTDLPRSVEMDEQVGCFRFQVRGGMWDVSVVE